jgi:phthiodiolone/phenolphthiodiolone dimycocerosates ketoreductase
MAKVKYGLFGVQFPPLELNAQAVKFYEQAGLDFIAYSDQTCFTIPRSIWTPDIIAAAEHGVDVDTALDPMVMMSQAAMLTERIELSVMAMDVFRRAPSVIAQGILSLDHISKGRAHFYLGAGEIKQFKTYGLSRERPMGRLEEAMEVVRLLVERTDPVDFDGRIWKMKNALMTAEPYGGKAPKIGAVGGGKGIEIAGRLGDGWGVFMPACGEPEIYAKQVKEVKEHAERAGKDPEQLVFQASIMSIIERDEAAVQRATENLALRWDCAATLPSTEPWKSIGLTNPLGDNWSYSRDLVPAEWSREDALAIANQVSPETVRKLRVCGTPEDAARQIQPYIEAGANYVWAANYSGLVSAGELGSGDTGVEALLDTYAVLRKINGQPAPVGTAAAVT